MKTVKVCLIGFVFVVCASAEPLLEGRVRLESGEPVADAQVRLFDLTDLRQGAVARAQTDGRGYFALPLAALGGHALPEGFALGPNYPNPFNPSTIIPYQLAASSQVRLEVFNLLGQRIATLVDGERPAGFHTATWHATDATGRAVGAGVYIYRMTVGAASQTGRMVLIDGQAGVSAAGAASVWSGVSDGGGSDGAGEQVYGLIVSGAGLVPYMDSAFRVEAGMAPVELVVSSGLYPTPEEQDGAAEEPVPITPAGKILASADAPGEPTNLRVEAITDSSARVRWDAVAGATDYDVNYRTAVGGKWTNEPHKGTRLYNTIYDLEPGTEYRWAVRAENSDGPSAWVFGANFTTRGEALEEDGPSEEPEPDAPVTIPDAKLRAAIAKALGKASGATITVAEMETLATLKAHSSDISDLTGLEFAINLKDLNLNRNNISDVSPLRGLTKLTQLWLSDNNVSDVSPLRGLTKLGYLDLGSNNISDVSPLRGLTKLYLLALSSNNISDVSPLRGLTKLTWLSLDFNNISDVSPLRGLTKLTRLSLRANFLNISSINDHIPALKRSGATVFFDSLRESDFDIELVFLDDDFDEKEKRIIRYAAGRWMSIIRQDLPDYTFTGGWSHPSYTIPSGERIDDLRIYVNSFNDADADAPAGWGAPHVLRETSHLPVTGEIGLNLYYSYDLDFLSTTLHEIGHVLGVGTEPWYNNGFVQESPNDAHFNGPLAIAAFNDAGGRNYTGKKVPLQKGWGHWRQSVLRGELMAPHGGESRVSAITIQSLADVGYVVDVTQADPYTLPRAAAKVVAVGSTPDDRLPGRLAPQWTCGVGQERQPIHVVDPQGRIIRTLGD